MRSRSKLPWLTLTVASLAVVASAVPSLSRLFVFDRAAISSGQWWRLVTGNWVHFSVNHLEADALAVGVAGYLIERRSRRGLFRLCAVSALVVGLAVFLFAPEVVTYGGLSGVACAAVAYLAIDGMTQSRLHRWLFAAALVLLVAKVSWEYATGRALFVNMHDGMVVLPLAHAAGLLSGFGCWTVNAAQAHCPSLKFGEHHEDPACITGG